MKERPIIFNAEMVRAILDGRKTQTRRILVTRPTNHYDGFTFEAGKHHPHIVRGGMTLVSSEGISCPFGLVGDRLWVRETWQLIHSEYDEDEITYAPSIPEQQDSYWQPVYEVDFKGESRETRGFPWRPSIHMPRHACRLVLEITGVRVERLGDISNDDAKAEGVTPAGELLPNIADAYLTPKGDFATAKVAFQRLWESIYGAESWQAKPWVWVIEFKVVRDGN